MTREPSSTHPLIDQAQTSVRSYSGEHQAHAHGHAQILFALQGRMELEVGGRPSFVDSASGMIIPAGTEHGYLAAPQTQVLVIDAPVAMGLDKLRRFAALVAAAERDACAQIVERNASACRPHSELHDVLSANALAIRARAKEA